MGLWQLILHMLSIWCVAGMVFWVCDIVPKKISRCTRWVLIVVFGLLSIYILEMAPVFKTEPIRIHAVIALTASITFNPLVGIGAGILCGMAFMLFHGFLAYPAEVYMPLIAALIGMVIWICGKAWPNCRFIRFGVLRPEWGLALGFLTEALYIFLAYKYYPGGAETAAEITWITAIPTALSGAVATFLCLYVYHDRRLE